MAVNPTKHEMPTQAPEVRARNFQEVALGYPLEVAKAIAGDIEMEANNPIYPPVVMSHPLDGYIVVVWAKK